MFFTKVLRQHRQPMIRFLGKRTTPTNMDHTPQVHPASPTASLPDSFASYRQKAQQHGPLTTGRGRSFGGSVGGHSGASLGAVRAETGEYFDRRELPARFRRSVLRQDEIEAIDSGGASLFA